MNKRLWRSFRIQCMSSQICWKHTELRMFYTCAICCACTIWFYVTGTVNLLLQGQVKLTMCYLLKSNSVCHCAILWDFWTSKKKHDTSSVSAAGQWIRALPTKMGFWQLSQCIALKCFTVFWCTDSEEWQYFKWDPLYSFVPVFIYSKPSCGRNSTSKIRKKTLWNTKLISL